MAHPRRLTALALARALLAGPQAPRAMSARLAHVLGRPAAWQQSMAERAAAWPAERWQRMQPRTLADWIERDPDYLGAWLAHQRPVVRHHILRPRLHKLSAPLGLHEAPLPDLPNVGALAQWLGLTTQALWRLTWPSARQRKAPLARQHHRFQWLAKRQGGWRLLEVPEGHLLGVQRKLLAGLLNHVPPHEAACGFAKGRSVREHAATHVGQSVLLKFDLQDFFSSVRASRVHSLFATLGYPDEVARALTALCTLATPEAVLARGHSEGGLSWTQRQRLRDPHLAQGAATSPALANLCAFRLDLRLQGLADALGARYTRYADDMVLSGPDHLLAAGSRIRVWVSRIAAEEGFALNPAKTHIVGAAQRQQVCGIVVNRKLNLPREDFDRLKAVLHRCVCSGPDAANADRRDDWRQHLTGRVAWAAQLNPAKAERLKRLLDRIDWSQTTGA